MPHPRTRRLRPALAVLLPLLAGGLLVAVFVATRTPPARDAGREVVRRVMIIEAPATPWRPRATGFGEARPARVWRAVAEVSGRIVERHPELETGAILPRGALLLRIDRADYELAAAEAEASIAARRAQLEDLEAHRDSLRRSLEIERRRLAVAERELERQQRLLEQGSVSRAEVDRQEREFLQQRQAVQELENTLARIPAERRRLEAELARDRARLQQAERDLPRTRIVAPYDLRVSAVHAERDQYVRAGETLMEGDDVGASEVEAGVPVQQFRSILRPVARGDDLPGAQLDQLLAAMDLTAEIRLRASGASEPMARWPARVDRISDAIDPRTRTIGVVAVVDRPYEKARPPEKPPLVKGMYVEVRFCAPPRPAAVVLPRTALHEDRVYVVGDDERLEIRRPGIAFRHGGFVVIGDGIDAGERVVLSDPVPAIGGMKLSPRADAAARAALVTEARGARDCP